MRGQFDNGYVIAKLAGNNSEAVGAELEHDYGLVYVYDKATGTCKLAHDDTVGSLFISTSSTKKVGDPVTLYSIKTLNRSFFSKVTETCARGTDLYLDDQATEAAATGKLKVTQGTATNVLFVADDVVSVADTGVVPVISQEHFA